MTQDVMCDLETLGANSHSVILAIGAVKFDIKSQCILQEYHATIDPQSCIAAGLKIDAATVMWWLKQPQEARAQFEGVNRPLREVLSEFSAWLGVGNHNRIWGNGATFDNVILGNAFDAVGLKRPWPFWGDMCYRTIKNLNPNIKIERVGTHHNALDDATSQAHHLMKILSGQPQKNELATDGPFVKNESRRIGSL